MNKSFCLCNKCRERLENYYKTMEVKKRESKEEFEEMKNSYLELSDYALKKNVSFNREYFEELRENGTLVEVQRGRDVGEKKFIIRFEKNDSVVHTVVLVGEVFGKKTFKILNAYNPHIGMSFKWDDKALNRVYLNEFRGCCLHPEDKKENFVKRHHGVNHKLYDYQVKMSL